jgi:hypothetical protein
MENNTTTGQSNLNTKHSILSAQADLNTGTIFHNDPIPKAAGVPVSQQVQPKPLPESVQEASEEFRKRMEMEKAKSVASLQSTVDNLAPTVARPVAPAPKPLPQSPSAPLEHAESTKPLNNPFVGMNSARPSMPQHSIAMGNDVVFENETTETTPVKKSGGGHAVILTISILIILGILGGGAYYWYAYMGGKDMVQKRLNPANDSVEGMEKSPVVEKPVPAFPAAIRPTVSTTTPVVSKPAVVNTNTFAPSAPKPVTTTPKKTITTFGDAEKEIVSTYVSTNINKLSRVKSATGFSVEDIRFDGPNRAIVSYSDGDMSVSAVLNFTYTNGSVKVNSFSILEK